MHHQLRARLAKLGISVLPLYHNYISSMLDQCAPLIQRVSAFLSVWKGFFCFCFITSLWQESYDWSESTLRFLIFETCIPNMNSVLNDIILYCRKQEECCWNIAEGIPIFGVCFKFSATTFTQWCQVSIYHLETKTGLSFLQVLDVQFQSYATSIVIDDRGTFLHSLIAHVGSIKLTGPFSWPPCYFATTMPFRCMLAVFPSNDWNL